MAGFKLRVPPVDTFRAMAEAWGARATPIAFGELYLALSQGAVDGQENPLPTIQSGKFCEVQKFLVLTEHIITPRMVIVNEAFWKGLRPADRDVLQAALAGGAAWQDKELLGQEATLVGTFKAAGMTRHRARPRAVAQAGARQGADAVRGQMGQGHLRIAAGAVSRVAGCVTAQAVGRPGSTARCSAGSGALVVVLLGTVTAGVVFACHQPPAELDRRDQRLPDGLAGLPGLDDRHAPRRAYPHPRVPGHAACATVARHRDRDPGGDRDARRAWSPGTAST